MTGAAPSRLAGATLTVVGVALALLAWEVAGRREALGRSLPPATDVWAYLADPLNRPLLERALTATVVEALNGLVIGVTIALLLAAAGAVVPALRPGLGRLSAVVNAAPWIALGPVFAILYREQTPVIISTLAVFFTCFVAFSSGLQRIPDTRLKVFASLGAGPVRRLVSLQLPQAVPSILDGLRLALPAAMVGAIFGEWFGAGRGLGALLVSAMQNLRTEQLWAAAVLAAGVSLLGYLLLSVLHTFAAERFA